MYVAIEGVDTAGKSTQINLLKSTFPQALFTLEPGGSALGVRLREILLSEERISERAEFLMFLSDRAEHCCSLLLPNAHRLIISDRSMISGIAYAKNLSIQEAAQLNLFATQGHKPDCVIVLHLSKEELQKRLSTKHQDRIELRGVEYLLTIQERMLQAIEYLGIASLILDASLPVEILHAKIKERLT